MKQNTGLRATPGWHGGETPPMPNRAARRKMLKRAGELGKRKPMLKRRP